ncbi:MAG: hypothetical protein ACLR2G_04895 [Phascolarctobacterium faecium]
MAETQARLKQHWSLAGNAGDCRGIKTSLIWRKFGSLTRQWLPSMQADKLQESNEKLRAGIRNDIC